MATIDDFGGTTDPLNAPPLGGPSGWAAAVRDAIKGKVSKAGDAMAGALTFQNGMGVHYAPTDQYIAPLYDDAGSIVPDPALRTQLGVFYGPSGALKPLNVGNPTQQGHAATKGYVDNRIQRGSVAAPWDLNWHRVDFPTPYQSNAPIVVASIAANATHPALVVIGTTDLTGFLFTTWKPDGSSVSATTMVDWVAVGD